MPGQIPPLQPPNSIHLKAAEGWLELGNIQEANRELEEIEAGLRSHPDVLEVRWQIYAKLMNWEASVDIAKAITKLRPDQSNGWIHLAYSTRLMEGSGLWAAIEVLKSVVEQFPDCPMVCYYLACYTSRFGRLVESEKWWNKALDIAKRAGSFDKIRLMALDEPDLEPLLRGTGKTA
jgi:predicted Zn-dependent protease